MGENPVILFDGECIFCNSAVQFIIKHDQEGYFHFAALQSSFGIKLIKNHPELSSIDSIILVQNGIINTESSAALQIAKKLDGWPKLCFGLIVVPSAIRDYFYRLIAKNRYKFFGKNGSCMVPTKEVRDRFFL